MKDSKQDMIDYYDRNPDLTLLELSRIVGVSVKRLKELLMEGD